MSLTPVAPFSDVLKWFFSCPQVSSGIYVSLVLAVAVFGLLHLTK